MMNLKVCFILILLSIFPFSGNLLAYQPGPDIIRECPQCQSHLVQKTTLSGNTFGARFWTDGKMIAPMLPDRPWLVKCPSCNALFWIDEAKELGRQYRLDGEKKWLDTVEAVLPSEQDILRVLSDEKLAKGKAMYARRLIWWMVNDTARTKSDARLTLSDSQEKNLSALAQLLDENDAEQRIMKAEIFRELGRFYECITLLSYSFQDEYKSVVSFIKRLAEEKDRIVREIKE